MRRLGAIGLLAAAIGLIGAGGADAAPTVVGQFFERHCTSCHSGTEPAAKLDLSVLPEDLADQAALARAVRIHDRIAAGEMPPADMERPSSDEVAAVTAALDRELLAADRTRIARHGRARLRRMTRSEYENTLRDLLGLDRLEIRDMLPADDEIAGFDKVAEALDVSPVHLAAYAEAANHALGRAIATRSTPPPVFKRRIYPAGLFKFSGNLLSGNFVLLKDGKPDPALPIRGGFDDVAWYISAPDADADLEARKAVMKENKVAESQSSVGLLVANLAGYEAAWNVAPIYDGRYRLRLSLWGFQWNKGAVEPLAAPQAAVLRAHEEGKQQEGGRLLAAFTAPSLAPKEYEITTWLDAHESIVFDPVSIFWPGLQVRQIGGRTAKHVGSGVALDWFEVEGPIHESWPPESHRRLFGDLPIAKLPEKSGVVPPERRAIHGTPGYLPSEHADLSPADRKPPLETVLSNDHVADARRLLGGFLPRTFRRPVAAGEVEPYVALVAKRIEAGDCFEDAMRRAYVAVLTSPEMLFHPADRSPAGQPSTDEVADGSRPSMALASRLSYWLWNGPPDEGLVRAAADGSLRRPEVLHEQVERLLADPRSRRFIEDFTDQWLELDRIDETTPDRKLYPEYSWLLREGMVEETRSFVAECLAKDLPIRTLVDADFAMLTQRLAEHYRLEGIEGVDVRRVDLPPGSHRGGLLAQAAIHKLTANGTTTSPVKRGLWVMDRLFNKPPPPPPPGVSAVDPDTRGATTIREQLDRHRSDASCAACHAKIDPPGFALECFDPIGGYRDRYRSSEKGDKPPPDAVSQWRANYRQGPKVDASGALPNGKTFDGIDDFRKLLAAHPRGLAKAFVAHLVRYATGADISYADRPVIDEIVDAAKSSEYGVRALVHGVAASRLLRGE